jgi:acyl transferase domain-containing protein
MQAEDSAVHQPEISQPLVTALQVAIIDLLSTWNVRAAVVIGHSSGEIAAAYASGAVSRESAWMIAYFRGLAVSINRDLSKTEGSMVAVQATPEAVAAILDQQNLAYPQDRVVIACYNSPTNVTCSGSRVGVVQLTNTLAAATIPFRLLQVDVAYHSYYMNEVGIIYSKLLRPIEGGDFRHETPYFVSTVTGEPVEDLKTLRTPMYWVKNLTAPVQFLGAMKEIYTGEARKVTAATANLFLEIGPHSTLRSPLKDVLKIHGGDITTDYVSVLVRGQRADVTALECAGKLHSTGLSIDLTKVNETDSDSDNLLTTLPPYPFNDKTKYWLEGRTSAQYRFRSHVHHDFLGTRVDDWNTREARWVNRIVLGQLPWLKDHQVNGSIIFPAAAFMVMAVEAVRQFHSDQGSTLGYELRNVKFPKAVKLSEEYRGIELQLTLRTGENLPRSSKSEHRWEHFNIYVYEKDDWVECCSGDIAVEYKEDEWQAAEISERKEFLRAKVHAINSAIQECHTSIDSQEVYAAFEQAGLAYGPFFKALQDVKWNGNGQATGAVCLQQWLEQDNDSLTDSHLIHPTALDNILQMTFPAYSIYNKNASATTVPTGFRNAWFSADLANATPGTKALVHAKVLERGFRNKLFSITAALADGQRPCFFGEMETATIGSVTSAPVVARTPLYRIDYQPDFDLLPNRTFVLEPHPSKDSGFIHNKELLCLASIRNALDQVQKSPATLPLHLQEYIMWMRNTVSKHTTTTSESIDSMCNRLEHHDVESRLLVRIARNLTAILTGKVDPLTLLFQDDILSEFYANFHSNQQLLTCAADQVNQLAYKHPAMRVLEIGAGTGSATAHILHALGDRVAEYVYTDVTPSFFIKARERFPSEKVVFKTLDVSRDPMAQGFRAGEFDLIVAANVSLYFHPFLWLLLIFCAGSSRSEWHPKRAGAMSYVAAAERPFTTPRNDESRAFARTFHLWVATGSVP